MRALLPALSVVLLPGCFFSSNSMRAKWGAPFELGAARSALFQEGLGSWPEGGRGDGFLLLTTETLGCAELEAYLIGDVDVEDAFLWDGRGILAGFEWSAEGDEGWEGLYLHGMYAFGGYGYTYGDYDYDYGDDETPDPTPAEVKATRVVSSQAFADGVVYALGETVGHGEILDFDDIVQGTLDTEFYRARFKAERCGSLGLTGSPTDTAAYGTSY